MTHIKLKICCYTECLIVKISHAASLEIVSRLRQAVAKIGRMSSEV